MEETFTYDDMNRLTGVTLKRASGQDLYCAVTYDALGRMTSRQTVTAVNGVPQVTTVFSQPVFHSTKVHALSTAQTTESLFPTSSQSIAYTGFDKVSKIKQSNDSLCYTYGYDRQRIRMEEYKGNTIHAKDYVGMCEYVTETDLSGTVAKSRTFITGPYGVFAVVEKRNGVETLHYILKDNLGSWTTITNSVGTVEQQLSYDAWDSRRNPDTWANYTSDDTYAQPMFDRGYTGHEHLSLFGLINMNGRMYDPVMSSFLSVDRYVQNPMSAQGFNRYAYCMYNPLRYVDPTGWLSGGGGGYNSNGSLPQVMINGQAVFVLPEITIKPHEFNHEFVFDPYPFADGGGDLQWNNANNEQTIGSAIRGCGGGGYRGTPSNTQSNQNINIEIISNFLAAAGVYTSTEAALYYNRLTRTWRDKMDIIRDFDFHGNGSTGGINSYGKAMSAKYTNAGRITGSLGVLVSINQCINATTIESQLEYGMDTFIGLAGVVAPEFFGLPSTVWFFGGKQVSFWYGRTIITPMINQGVNPGIMEYQPFK